VPPPPPRRHFWKVTSANGAQVGELVSNATIHLKFMDVI
jgi:hypothetical protein